ncbi:hypothetical protein Bca52824_088528 [Brassica carinata]|uniref:Uncharacterized protein n=1 Tax=Brassica carinata TaxID=52824 RepID=A0A8X7PCX5_BRACI|nr:hypothetical protein Bca52824_088528 [Brassica carinata]
MEEAAALILAVSEFPRRPLSPWERGIRSVSPSVQDNPLNALFLADHTVVLSPQGGEDKEEDTGGDSYYNEVSPLQPPASLSTRKTRPQTLKSIIISPSLEGEEESRVPDQQENLTALEKEETLQEFQNKGHFRPNDTYDANRRLILSSLPSNVTSQEGLFFNGSIGQEPNRVYATGMCIPGSTPQDCSDCIKIASDRLIESCSNQTNAFTWLGDPTLCLVRYASTSFSGSGDLTPRRKSTSAALTSSQNCTPDVSSRDCKNCLRQSANDFHSCCALKRGTRILRPICFFRWELYDYSTASFAANFTVASSSPSHLPPVVVPEPADDQDNTIDTEDRKGISSRVVAAITVPTVVILLVLGVFLCCRRKSMQRTQVESDSDISTPHSSQYDFKTIEVATNKFSRSNKLGEGGFGEVYKGTLSNGTEVAVKRLSKKSGQGIREFKNEAVLVSKLQHRNLVRLLGFCLEGDEKILIYEFVPNKSLNYFIFGFEKQIQLDWIQRYNIIEGIARGILYLHQDSQLTIIHRDLKASNILLDANMNPKISDFGLSTIFATEQTRGNTRRIAGTYGYMSPEYAMQGQYSMKSDIYSFGVLVLEIISGKKNGNVYQMDESSADGNFVTYALEKWVTTRAYQSNEVTRCIHIALLCVQDNPIKRPLLSTIILMLTSNTITLPVPRLPRFIPRGRHELDLESSQSTGKSVVYSVNDVSITALEPR